jgi:hypothetical protein
VAEISREDVECRVRRIIADVGLPLIDAEVDFACDHVMDKVAKTGDPEGAFAAFADFCKIMKGEAT